MNHSNLLMKNLLTLSGYVLVLSAISFGVVAQSQTTPVNCPPERVTTCTQSNWAVPYLTTVGGQVVASGQLQPDTPYNLVLEALPPVATCSSIIFVAFGDGFVRDETGLDFDGPGAGGVDLPAGQFPGQPYKVRLRIRTKTGPEFVSQLYFRYRLSCSALPGQGTGGSGSINSTPQQQAFVP